MAARVGADLAHVPYWGSPLNSPIPVVVTIHDLIPLILPAYRGSVLARLYTGMVGAAARGAAAVITDSRASGEDIAQHLRIPADHIYPIPLAASSVYQPRQGSLVDMAIRKKYKLPVEYVLYLGGYDIRKNVHTLLKAFTYVRTGYDIPLVLAGRLPEKKSSRFIDVSSYIDLMELGDIVQVVGEIEEDDKPAIYRMAKTFVFPSRYEGFGLPVLEAMACGKAVVTTNAPSLPELVGDAAFVVDPDDARHMAGSILATLTQPDTNEDLSRKALARASEFSWARTAAETTAVYSQILSTS
jgi:glycosyltransferase involved in cell wall biosynthesis